MAPFTTDQKFKEAEDGVTLSDIRLNYYVGVSMSKYPEEENIKVEDDGGAPVVGRKREAPETFPQPLYKRHRSGCGPRDDNLERMLNAMTEADMQRLLGELSHKRTIAHKRDWDFDDQGKPYAVE